MMAAWRKYANHKTRSLSSCSDSGFQNLNGLSHSMSPAFTSVCAFACVWCNHMLDQLLLRSYRYLPTRNALCQKKQKEVVWMQNGKIFYTVGEIDIFELFLILCLFIFYSFFLALEIRVTQGRTEIQYDRRSRQVKSVNYIDVLIECKL